MENRSNDQIITEKRSSDGDGKVYSKEVYRNEKRFWMPVRKISWPAIFAGVLVTTVTQMLLSLLGIGIGFGTIDAVRDQSAMAGIGVGSIIWWSATMLLALFMGGLTTGRLYPSKSRTELTLHGLLTWCTFTVLSFFMLTTSLGRVISGAGNILGTALTATSSMAENQLDISGLMGEARGLILPGNQPQKGEPAQQRISPGAQLFLRDVEGFFRGDVNDIQTREALINSLVRETGMSRSEAAAQADKWTASYEDLKAKAKVKADQAAKAISTASIVGFFALLLGALITVWGAMTAPTDIEEYPMKRAA